MGSNADDLMGLCGRDSGCFVGLDGPIHNEAWHRLQGAEAALRSIRDTHAKPDRSGASCAEGCGGRWPCSTWAEANHALEGSR